MPSRESVTLKQKWLKMTLIDIPKKESPVLALLLQQQGLRESGTLSWLMIRMNYFKFAWTRRKYFLQYFEQEKSVNKRALLITFIYARRLKICDSLQYMCTIRLCKLQCIRTYYMYWKKASIVLVSYVFNCS